ncbi:glycerophosphodiester phosphodiesterase [Aerococcus urinaehominis]|uniref:Glycerophosphodiester phosphodiesterase n=2 Tax=Aerococcus urinaehominis TaxID=128944 RepID=A0A0X8FK91_9LACT|nr:glycerophosphodiester phosphodiesterase [Aerococcus urinaehominis]
MTKVIAHRGYSKLYPENTMLAFKKAAEYDIYGIELDVQLSKDGTVVICHDESVERTSNGQGEIKDLTINELKELTFDKGMASAQGQVHEDITIPTLDEFLAWIQPHPLIINIELKTNLYSYPGIEKKVAQLIDQYGLADRTIVSSFNHESLMTFKELAPHVKLGFLTAQQLYQAGDYCARNGVQYYHPYYITLSQSGLEDLAKNSVLVNTYTVNQAEDMQKLAAKNINALITDDVELAIASIAI